MKSRLRKIFTAIAVTLGAIEIQAQVSPPYEPHAVPGQVLIRFKSEKDLNSAFAAAGLQQLGLTAVKPLAPLPVVLCRFSDEKNIDEMLRACRALPGVAYAEPNYHVHAMEAGLNNAATGPRSIAAQQEAAFIPNDARFNDQWNLDQQSDHDIDAPEAWDLTTGSPGVIVGIVDTGIDYDHEDLQNNVWFNPGETGGGKENNNIDDDGNGYVDDWRGWDFANRDNDPYDDNGGGTHAAGIIGAVGNNGQGVAGLNWKVQLMALKFLAGNGVGSTVDAAEAIIYASDNGARVLSNNWGGGGFSQLLQEVIQYAHDRGVLFVATAGRAGTNNDVSPVYPAGYDVPNVVSVTSSDRQDKLFGNYGRRTVDLAAPGLDILSTFPLQRYQSLPTGATPQVAGACALVWARFPEARLQQVLIRVLGAVDRKTEFTNLITTAGRLNAANALSSRPIVAYTTTMDNTTDTVGPYVIQTSVVDDGVVRSVVLAYSINGGPADTLQMAPGKDDEYLAEIPGQPFNSNVDYTVLATDDQGNRTASPTFRFSVGSMPAPVFDFRTFPRVTNDPTPYFEWEAVSGASGYHVSLSFNPEFFPGFVDSTVSPSYEVPSPLPDGAWYIRIRSFLNPKVTSVWSAGELFTVDATAPIEAMIRVNEDSVYTRSRAVALQFDAVGVRIGIDSVRFANGDETEEVLWSLFDERTRPWELAEGEDGLRRVYIQFKDRAGNYSEPDSDSIVLDRQGPVFSSQSPRLSVATPALNQAIEVIFNPPKDGGTGLLRFDLWYRRAGEAWRIIPFQKDSAPIPPEYVTNRGLDYRIVAEDVVGNLSMLPDSIPYFFSIPVSIAPGEAGSSPGLPGGTTAAAYRLVSMPLVTEKQAVSEVFTNLGAYGAMGDYRFWRLEAEKRWREEGAQLEVKTGEAYFLIKRESVRLSNKSAGVTAKTSDGAWGNFAGWQLRAHDWTLIGNPFNFEIDLGRLWLKNSDIRLDTMRNVWSYDGAWRLHPQRLEPWSGIAVFNSGEAETLLYYPTDENLEAPSRAEFEARPRNKSFPLQNLGENDWLLAIRVESSTGRDDDNYFGVRQGARTGPDEFDYAEPPLLPGGLSLSFIVEDERHQYLAVDIRPSQQQLYEWVLRLQSQDKNVVRLRFEELERFSPEFEIWLTDDALRITQNLREIDSYTIAGSQHPKILKLVVGNKNLIEDKFAGMQVIPTRYELSQNFPNPFNPVTTIRYGLPQAGRVSLKIYNLLGEEVATLIHDEQKVAGYHISVWDGKDKNGVYVASGVYVYRMRAGNSVIMSKKLALIK